MLSTRIDTFALAIFDDFGEKSFFFLIDATAVKSIKFATNLIKKKTRFRTISDLKFFGGPKPDWARFFVANFFGVFYP